MRSPRPSRIAQKTRDRAEAILRRQEIDTRRRALEAQIALLTAEFEEVEDKVMWELRQEELLEETRDQRPANRPAVEWPTPWGKNELSLWGMLP